MALSKTESNIDLILNQISQDVFKDASFDMTEYPNELFLLEDTSIDVFRVNSLSDYTKMQSYLYALKKHTDQAVAYAIMITSSTFTGVSGINPATIYLATYTNTLKCEMISGKQEDNITAEDIKEVPDIVLK